MKKSSLLLLMGTVIGGQALLGGTGILQSLHMPFLHDLPKVKLIATAQAEETATVKYTCPMHPQVISKTPGKCPICGMDLVSIETSGQSHVHEEQAQDSHEAVSAMQTERKILYWYAPMVPGKKFDKPGKSPFMDMDLVPKYADEENASTADGGKPIISIKSEYLQKMGVKTEKAKKSVIGGGLRLTGTVMENERARHDLFSQIEGRIDTLYSSAPGDPVKKGDVFYTLYSPELLALQNDYLATLKGGDRDLASAARKRMTLLGVDERVIKDIAAKGKAFDSVPFYIPAEGVLNRLDIRKGYYLEANGAIGQILDLSTVWIEASVPERDMKQIKEGDGGKVQVSGMPDALDTKADYIYPSIDPVTRTGKVRFVVENQDYLLKPSSYVTVTLSSGTRESVVVPNSAILRDSSGDHVIIGLGEGRFQARNITTGFVSGGRTEIMEGLSENEDVVTNGQFLIDSESNLREALQKVSSGNNNEK